MVNSVQGRSKLAGNLTNVLNVSKMEGVKNCRERVDSKFAGKGRNYNCRNKEALKIAGNMFKQR